MKYYVVMDTNVIVSAMLSKNSESAAVQVFRAMMNGLFTPLYHEDIIAEYKDVLHRPKFHFSELDISNVLKFIKEFGVEVFPQPTGEILIDMDDLIFYEVAMEKRDNDAYLVTGNMKHYPLRDFIVTPAELIRILLESQDQTQKS